MRTLKELSGDLDSLAFSLFDYLGESNELDAIIDILVDAGEKMDAYVDLEVKQKEVEIRSKS